MNRAVLFSSRSDEWETPQELFDALHAEFNFQVDLAAGTENRKCDHWWAKDDDSLAQTWHDGFSRGWLNPPYSRGLCAKFIAKAAAERRHGFLTVMLLPARTDTKAFHEHIWFDRDGDSGPREGVEIRFLPGRLKFGGAKHGAPFPSMVIIFRPQP
jgi:site-specific DNA-methyltransferase (adenine-specific)